MINSIDFSAYEEALATAQDAIQELRNEAEELKTEFETWVEHLDSVIDSCETIEGDL